MIKIYDMETLEEREILFRGGSGADVSAPVAEILRAVQERGDAALREYTLRFDGAAPDALAVTAEEVDQAAAQVEPAFLAVLEEAAEHIRAYHARQKRESFVMTEREGVVLGQRIIPLARVGIYVPGGTAAYPSTVLMNAIPARIAGVGEMIMVTPPGRDGAVNPHILAAAKIAGVTRIYKVGGAQAVAALAYGTGTIPQVDNNRGPRKRLRGGGQAPGLRPGKHRHDRRALRGAGTGRRPLQSRLGGGGSAEPGGARPDGRRRAGH